MSDTIQIKLGEPLEIKSKVKEQVVLIEYGTGQSLILELPLKLSFGLKE